MKNTKNSGPPKNYQTNLKITKNLILGGPGTGGGFGIWPYGPFKCMSMVYADPLRVFKRTTYIIEKLLWVYRDPLHAF